MYRRSLPQDMEYENSYRPTTQPEHRTHVGKISPRGEANVGVLQDITAFRGIGQDHNAFGGPTYTGQHYPFPVYSPSNGYDKGSEFSFMKVLTGLAIWNLANEFNTYNTQDMSQHSKSKERDLKDPDSTSNTVQS